jgi:hypothetical protein
MDIVPRPKLQGRAGHFLLPRGHRIGTWRRLAADSQNSLRAGHPLRIRQSLTDVFPSRSDPSLGRSHDSVVSSPNRRSLGEGSNV